ncbi:MAG: MATE family efflux transporter [Gemmiger sp.]
MTDMTTGPAHRHLWRYALPLMLGNWLQLAYNAVDAMIAGRFIGQNALAAEGIAGPVMNLVILAITGLCLGAGVLMSEAFGAGDRALLRRTLATTLLFGAGLCTAVALAGLFAAQRILRSMLVPAEIFAITTVYLRITFLGAPFTFFYNALAAGFKAVGDAKTPLKFLAFSALLNAGLDLVLIGGLGMGILCSALTTVAAEAASAALAAWYLVKKVPELCPERAHWHIDRPLLRRILRYGSITALQQAVQPIGKVLIQGQVNALGVGAIAAFNAATRVDDFAFTPEQSIAQAITTFIAQNRGAQKRERIRPGFAAGLRLEAGYWLVIGSLTALLRTPLIALFVSGEGAAEVVALGSRYLGLMAAFYFLPAMTNGFQGFYRGMGRMKTTLLGTFVQTSLRVVCTMLLAPRIGITGIAFACACGWCAMLAFEIPWYFRCCKTEALPRRASCAGRANVL